MLEVFLWEGVFILGWSPATPTGPSPPSLLKTWFSVACTTHHQHLYMTLHLLGGNHNGWLGHLFLQEKINTDILILMLHQIRCNVEQMEVSISLQNLHGLICAQSYDCCHLGLNPKLISWKSEFSRHLPCGRVKKFAHNQYVAPWVSKVSQIDPCIKGRAPEHNIVRSSWNEFTTDLPKNPRRAWLGG